MSAVPDYPVRVEGRLDPELSRWLWLVKWILAIPHFVVLVFLWAAFFVLSVVALVAILVTGRYPRALFDFNVGVLRWTWRVAFYSYGALGTDRYPPFTLSEASDYPATLEIRYPERLSRGLALVKWWLLAIPQYLVVGILVGGGSYFAWQGGVWRWGGGPGLIGLLVLFAAVALLFTRRYPQGLFDFVMGLNRWVLRVAAYASLMTDAYPPFRLDQGGAEPGAAEGAPAAEAAEPEAETVAPAHWTAGRITLVVLGAIASLIALGLLAGGCAVTVVDQTQRDSDGYLMSPTEGYLTRTYALVSERFDADFDGPDWVAREFIGTVRIRSESDHPVFVGIGPAPAVAAYLSGVRREEVSHFGVDREDFRLVPGGVPAVPPTAQSFWVASAEGSGTQTLSWEVEDGSWRVVLMNADGGPGVDAELSIGARVPNLIWIGIGLLVAGAMLAAGAAALIWAGIPKGART